MQFFIMVQGLGPMMWTFMQWPALQKVAMSLPPAVAKAMSPPMKQLLSLQEVSISSGLILGFLK